ncbi:MAG: AMP-binding protein, partial [Acidobacteria bacterium]|nr:AMP-binding protein [Acidobacteriota bacterium]
ETLDLPFRQRRERSRSPRGAEVAFRLDDRQVEGLRKLAARTRSTLFLVLEAVLAELLGRSAGAAEVNVGTPVANRPFAELEEVIGFFVNTVVLRNRREPGDTVRQRIEATRQTALDAFAHQEIPFNELVQTLRPRRQGDSTPFFQVMLVLQKAHHRAWRLGDLETTFLEPLRPAALFDLTVEIEEAPEGLSGTFRYDRELFHEEDVRRLVDGFQALLQAFSEDPEAKVEDLVPAETAAGERAPQSLPRLFEAQARRRPQAVALVGEEGEETYGELLESSRRLAARLERLGCGPGSVVGVALPPTRGWIRALLAVMETGAAYLPLDPSLPKERLRYVLEDSGAAFLILPSAAQGGLAPQGSSCREAYLDQLEAEPAEEARHLRPVDPDLPAYVIYTSGSTGKPKGVLVTHR